VPIVVGSGKYAGGLKFSMRGPQGFIDAAPLPPILGPREGAFQGFPMITEGKGLVIARSPAITCIGTSTLMLLLITGKIL